MLPTASPTEGGFADLLVDQLAAQSEGLLGGPSEPRTDGPPLRHVTLGEMLARLGAAPGATPGLALTAPSDTATNAVATGSLSLPVRPIAGEVGSGFGMRKHPILGDHRMHSGVDIGAPSGTPIHAAGGGTITFAGPRGGYGNLVIIDHGNGLETRYAHARSLEVREGQHIAAGDVVATVGSTGRSTGPHLHFEVRRDGEAVDPAPYLAGAR